MIIIHHACLQRELVVSLTCFRCSQSIEHDTYMIHSNKLNTGQIRERKAYVNFLKIEI